MLQRVLFGVVGSLVWSYRWRAGEKVKAIRKWLVPKNENVLLEQLLI